MTTAAVIAIGDELTSGHCVDTNSAWISQRLVALGVPVALHFAVGDDLERTADVIRFAIDRCDLIVLSGGLGPTADDITRQAISAAVERPLVLDQSSLDHIGALFARRGRTMTDNNRVQALFPQGAQIIRNPNGTAPGIDLDVPVGRRNVRLIALPGVPAELQEMFQDTVQGRLKSHLGLRMIRDFTVKCFGVGESELETQLADLMLRGRDPLVGITVHQATISLRVVASGESESACAIAAASTLQSIRERLGDLVFGEGDEELQDIVVRQLKARHETLAVVDLGSEGLLCQWLRAADPDQTAFLGGIVGGRPDQVSSLLEVSPKPSANAPAVRRLTGSTESSLYQVSAERVRDWFRADYGLVLGGTTDREEPGSMITIGLAARHRFRQVRVPSGGHPSIRAARSAKFALDMIRRQFTTLSESV